jgi:hypothetical protein
LMKKKLRNCGKFCKMISVMRNKGFQLKTAKTKTFSALRVLLLAAFIFVKSNVKNKSCHVIISTVIS